MSEPTDAMRDAAPRVGEVAAAEAEPLSDEALRRAMATLAEAVGDPVKLAAMNAELRSTVKGCYAIMHVMVRRLGGDVRIGAADHMVILPSQTLQVKVAPDQSVHLWIESPDHRRKRK